MLKKNHRWRKTMAKAADEMIEKFDVFYRSKGSCSHFCRFDQPLMKKAIKAQAVLKDFNDEYVGWIKENVTKNPERFLP